MADAVLTIHYQHGLFMNWAGGKKGHGFEYHLLAMASKLIAMLRAPALLFYAFARNAQYSSRTGVALNAAALAAGAVIVATQLVAEKGPYAGWLLGLGIAGIAAPGLWAAFRWPGIVRKIAAVFVVIGFYYLTGIY